MSDLLPIGAEVGHEPDDFVQDDPVPDESTALGRLYIEQQEELRRYALECLEIIQLFDTSEALTKATLGRAQPKA